MVLCAKRGNVTEVILTTDYTNEEIKARLLVLDKSYDVSEVKEEGLKNLIPFNTLRAYKNQAGDMEIKKYCTPIKSVDLLKALCIHSQSNVDCFIWLGGARSSKSVYLNEDGTFSIMNEIDGSYDEVTEEQLHNEEISNVGKAIKEGIFYAY